MSASILELDAPEPAPTRQPTVEESLGNEYAHDVHYGCERRLGRRVAAGCPDRFFEPVMSWDCHFYFDASDDEQTRAALALRRETIDLFPDLTVNRPYRKPVGPHPTSMFSCELHTPAQFARYLPWLCVRRRGLSVLVHPNTNNEYDDHTANCYWLGPPLQLKLDIFRSPTEKTGVSEDVNNLATRYEGKSTVWKFGYGSNMGQEFLRHKKGLNPLDSKQSILHGFKLSFPKGKGIDFVEPSFATSRPAEGELLHGVSTLLSIEDAEKLNSQEAVGRAYNIKICRVELYDKSSLEVEVYVPTKPLAKDHPEGCCSTRYRDILVRGAMEANLDVEWIKHLQQLKTYTPSMETLALRASIPPVNTLPTMTIEQLRKHDGAQPEEFPHCISSCGYIFKHKTFFKVFHGRDVTFRNVLHSRGINLDANDDGGKSPFPRLSQLEPSALTYALHYRDRFMHKAGPPIAVLKEFWEEQEEISVPGIFEGNTFGSNL